MEYICLKHNYQWDGEAVPACPVCAEDEDIGRDFDPDASWPMPDAEAMTGEAVHEWVSHQAEGSLFCPECMAVLVPITKYPGYFRCPNESCVEAAYSDPTT